MVHYPVEQGDDKYNSLISQFSVHPQEQTQVVPKC